MKPAEIEAVMERLRKIAEPIRAGIPGAQIIVEPLAEWGSRLAGYIPPVVVATSDGSVWVEAVGDEGWMISMVVSVADATLSVQVATVLSEGRSQETAGE